MATITARAIKEQARALGFDKVGIVAATALTEEGARLNEGAAIAALISGQLQSIADLAAAARQFGLGEHFDINVPNIRDGLIPDPTWWRENRHEDWTGGLTVNYGIGQGAMGVTPLQLAVMAARLGNNGRAVVPRLVREAPGVREPAQPPHMSGIEAEYLARVRDGMFGVCNEPGGTAVRAGALELVRHPETGVATPLTPEIGRASCRGRV